MGVFGGVYKQEMITLAEGNSLFETMLTDEWDWI